MLLPASLAGSSCRRKALQLRSITATLAAATSARSSICEPDQPEDAARAASQRFAFEAERGTGG
jgi:hypothetical protein